MALDTMYAGKVNSPATKLDGAINDIVTTINVLDGSILPDAPNIAVIGIGEDAETILYGIKNVNELSNVMRGFQGTAKAWDSGESVARLFTAYDYDTLRTNINDLEGRLGESNTASNIGAQVEIYKQKTGVDLEIRTLKAGVGINLYNSVPTGNWNIENCNYDSISKSVSAQDNYPFGVAFSSDGSKMYIMGVTNDTVYQYSLSTAWNVGTASYDSISKSVSAQDASPYGLAFSSDGSKMYIVGIANDTVYQYSLSTPWNVGTASYDSISKSVSAQDIYPFGVAFSSDGSKMYIMGVTNKTIYQYSLSTAWNVGTASYNSISKSVSAQDGNPYGVAFSSDGSKMYIMGVNNKTVYQYSLSTAWNVGTASYDSISKSVSAQDASPYGLAFNSDGSKMYIVGIANDTVYQYTVGGTTEYDYVEFESVPSDIKLDDLGTPDDNTDLNASTTAHGLLPKLPNNSNKFLNGVGGYSSLFNGMVTIVADDTTPDVSNGNAFITSANTVATKITDLDNPSAGQIVILMGGSDTFSSTVVDGSSINAVIFTGTGLDDATSGGTFTGTVDTDYKIEIDGAGTPDTFKWSDDGGATWKATGVAITVGAIALNNGVTVTFAATTGHTSADSWAFTAYPNRFKLSADMTLSLDNSITILVKEDNYYVELSRSNN